MNIYPLIILVLLLTVLFFSIFRILHLPISKISRFFLSAFRVLLIFLITIAFLEPSFQFERLSPVNRTIPVLIDNSKSMSLFYPESTIIPFTKSLYAINNKCSGKNNRFAIYTFGDSLKKAIDSLTFFENRSNFPVLTRNSIIDKSPSIIIVSDANWTNRVQLSSMAETKTLYYIKLPKPHQSCHFYSDVKSSPGSTKDSIHFTFTITGFTTDSQSIILRCVTTDTTLYQKAFAIAPGSVQQTLDFNLKKLFPGLHVLRFQALINDSIVNEYRHLQLVSKDMYHYRTRFSTPSLDNRFLQLAFARDSSFMATDSDTADLLIISNYTGELSKKLSSISKNELLFFAGTLPCQPLRQSTTNVLIADYSSYSGFNRSGTATLPPISVYHNCLQLPAARIYAWVSSGQEHPDTIPALFTTTYNDKTALILSLTNFWKWDFYPLVSNFGEENTFAFSKRIVDAVKELLSLQSSSVYTAVVSNEVTDSDSLLIEHHLPQTFGYNDHITLHCTVKRDNTTVLDSSITMVHDGTGKLKTGFRPVPSGRYSYTIILYKKDEKYTYTDSAFIGTDNREYSVTGQNEYIFSDIARPLLLNDTVSLQRILYESNNSSIPVRQPVTFSRNWFLLLLILATYGIELFLRRQWKLD